MLVRTGVLVRRGEEMPLAALLQLRATSNRLREVITGHMPGDMSYHLKNRTDRNKVVVILLNFRFTLSLVFLMALGQRWLRLRHNSESGSCVQLQHVQLLLRLAGPAVECLYADIRFTPFLHMLPNLRHVVLQTFDLPEGALGNLFDVGSLIALTSLSCLSLGGGAFSVQQMEQLTQLRSLCLNDFQKLSDHPGPFCQLPTSLTSLDLVSDWYCPSGPSVGPVLQFGGQLESLILDQAYMQDLHNDPACLSTFACLQQLTCLTLSIQDGSSASTELNLPKLQSMHAEFQSWPSGPHPHWQLHGCPALRSLTLKYVCYEDELDDGVSRSLDLRGIHGGSVSSLHLELQVPNQIRAVADFDAWRLEEVSLEYENPESECAEHERTDWRKNQSVRDILGCLVGHFPLSEVNVNEEHVCD